MIRFTLLTFLTCISFLPSFADQMLSSDPVSQSTNLKQSTSQGTVIIGRILDDKDLSAVQRATVSVGGDFNRTVLTDNDGYFSLESGDIGSYPAVLTINFSSNTHNSRQFSVTIPEPMNMVSLGWLLVRKTGTTTIDTDPPQITLFGLLVDSESRLPIRTDMDATVENLPQVKFELDRTGVFNALVARPIFEQMNGRFLIRLTVPGYATTMTDARLSAGSDYYNLGVVKITKSDRPTTPEPPAEPEIPVEENLALLSDLQRAYMLIKQVEEGGNYLDREAMDLLDQIFSVFDDPLSLKHFEVLQNNNSLTVPCILTGMDIYRGEYLARMSRVLKTGLESYSLKQIRAPENQKFYEGLLATLSTLDNFYEENPMADSSDDRKLEIETFKRVIQRYFEE